MKTQLRVLCQPALAAGFAQAGVPVINADDSDRAIVLFRELLDDPTIGLVLMEESYHRQLPEDIRRQLARRPLPMVVPFPGLAWEARPEGAESYIVDLLRQVIGYRVRLR